MNVMKKENKEMTVRLRESPRFHRFTINKNGRVEMFPYELTEFLMIIGVGLEEAYVVTTTLEREEISLEVE
jgi:hypothetical protein